jgi:hypothetical protein
MWSSRKMADLETLRGARGDYLLNYIDNLIVLWIHDDDLAAHDKE